MSSQRHRPLNSVTLTASSFLSFGDFAKEMTMKLEGEGVFIGDRQTGNLLTIKCLIFSIKS